MFIISLWYIRVHAWITVISRSPVSLFFPPFLVIWFCFLTCLAIFYCLHDSIYENFSEALKTLPFESNKFFGRQIEWMQAEYLEPITTCLFMICPYFGGIAFSEVSPGSVCFLPPAESLTSIFYFLAFCNFKILYLMFQSLCSCFLFSFVESYLTHVQLRN